jgi:hypothetical protein
MKIIRSLLRSPQTMFFISITIMLIVAFLIAHSRFATRVRYKIKAGHHYHARHDFISPIENHLLIFEAKFGRGCLYDISQTEGDLNKLYGLTDCASSVHSNSARMAWRHNGHGTIEIFAYLYVNRERNFFKLGETVPNRWDRYEIHAEHDHYYFRFNEVDTTIARVRTCDGTRLRAFPYFGGDAPAPNDMIIYINEKK